MTYINLCKIQCLLRTLHDQTDRILSDTQAQLNQVERELYNAREKIRLLERERGEMDQETASLKNEFVLLKGTLGEVDAAKDGMLVSWMSATLVETYK